MPRVLDNTGCSIPRFPIRKWHCCHLVYVAIFHLCSRARRDSVEDMIWLLGTKACYHRRMEQRLLPMSKSAIGKLHLSCVTALYICVLMFLILIVDLTGARNNSVLSAGLNLPTENAVTHSRVDTCPQVKHDSTRIFHRSGQCA